MKYTQEWVDHFVREEGYRRTSYLDHLGNYTIGIGHLLGRDKKYKGVTWSDEKILATLESDLSTANDAAREIFPEYEKFSLGIQIAITDMCFNMGEDGFRQFKRTIRLLHEGRFVEAANGALQSKWATQVPNRAKRVTDLIRAGRWV